MDKAFEEAIEVLRDLMVNGFDEIKLEAARAILDNYTSWLERFPDRCDETYGTD